MPCNSDYMAANNREIQLSRVACLIDEFEGRTYQKGWWGGYHPSVYNNLTKVKADELVSKLCGYLQEADVTKYSLEMQIWWRDHQAADKARIEQEIQSRKDEVAKAEALAKLSPYEQKLLGV